MSQVATRPPGLDETPEPVRQDLPGVTRSSNDRSGLRGFVARFGPRLVSVLLVFGLWGLASAGIGSAVIPSPAKVWEAFQAALADGYVWRDMTVTFSRLVAAFALAMALAVGVGLAIGTIGWVARMFDIWITIAAAVPSLLYIVIAYLWLGLNDMAAIVAAAVVVAPSAAFNVIQGVRAIDPGLSEMARAFGISKAAVVRRVLFPQTLPYLFAAARSCLALTWKIVIFVELMGRSSGVGYRIQYFYSLFNMERVLASALPFMLVMLLVELVVLRRLEGYLFRWRREEAR
jgi:NitT/TauT family transport system permease protein